MYGADYLDSLGERAVHILPSNQSTLLADSRNRENPNSSVMNFKMNCDRIRMKEFYYSSIFWKQSLYTHNLTNIELKYRLKYNGVTSPTYVIYAMPFVTFTSFDGNPVGKVYAEPSPNVMSYARQMEWALNNDYRLDATDTDYTANYTDLPWCPPGGVNLFFRYNSSKGFAIWVQPTDPALLNSVSIQLQQSDYFKNGHNIHGFGFPYPQYQPSSNADGSNAPESVYGPNNLFLPIYFAEAQPNLMHTRYIVIQSPELTKDRRIPSFHSGNVSNFNNEIAVFSLNLRTMGVWHTDKSNEDTAVVSIRENYSPESATFIVCDEYGKELIPSTIYSNWLNDANLPIPDKINMLSNSTSYGGCRGSPRMMNYLLFNFFESAPISTDRFPLVLRNNYYGNGEADCWPDDVVHELTVIIKDN